MSALPIDDEENPTLLRRIEYANDNGEALWEKQLLPRGRGFSPRNLSAVVCVHLSEFELGIGANHLIHDTTGERERVASVFVHLGPVAMCLEYRSWWETR